MRGDGRGAWERGAMHSVTQDQVRRVKGERGVQANPWVPDVYN